MARNLSLSLLLIFTILQILVPASSAVPRHSNPTDFIVSACKATRYPALCVQSLSAYASNIRQSQRQLAQTALSVSVEKARSAVEFVAKLGEVRGIKGREYQAVKDCIENMGDSVDRLSQAVKEIEHLGRTVGHDFMWHMSNVQTWVSAALTDENTCLDSFSDRSINGNLKVSVRRRVVTVAQVTSNALALVNQFMAKHRL